MQVPTDFLTFDYLATFAGMVLAVALIVQFSKSLVKNWFSDQAVRVYAFAWALVLVVIVAWVKGAFAVAIDGIVQQALLCLLNAIIVTTSAMGAYEAVTDPGATKKAE